MHFGHIFTRDGLDDIPLVIGRVVAPLRAWESLGRGALRGVRNSSHG